MQLTLCAVLIRLCRHIWLLGLGVSTNLTISRTTRHSVLNVYIMVYVRLGTPVAGALKV